MEIVSEWQLGDGLRVARIMSHGVDDIIFSASGYLPLWLAAKAGLSLTRAQPAVLIKVEARTLAEARESQSVFDDFLARSRADDAHGGAANAS